MLQQTQVATVIPYYERFVDRFPSVVELADANEETVLQFWEGLGYYRRARMLHRAAQEISEQHGGQFPTTYEDVLALPGVGRYTAGAVLSISLNHRLPILEGNTVRLFSRLLASFEDASTGPAQKKLWEFSEWLLPRRNVGQFNQALMELGGEICTPKSPDCRNCPLRSLCPALAHGIQEQLPVTGKKMKYESIREAAIVVRRKNRILVRQCGADERWTGLFDFLRFPIGDTDSTRELEQRVNRFTGLNVQLGERFKTIKHAVTRFRITLDCYLSDSVRGRISRDNSRLRWVDRKALDDLPLNTTGRQITKLLADHGTA